MAQTQPAPKRCVVCHKATGPSDGESVLSNGRGKHGHAKCIRCGYLPPGEFLAELSRSVEVLFSKARDKAENLRAATGVVLEAVAECLLRIHENRENDVQTVRLSIVPLVERAEELRLSVLGLKGESSFRNLSADVTAAAGRIAEITRVHLFYELPLPKLQQGKFQPVRIASASASM
jgi:hypothetical protein